MVIQLLTNLLLVSWVLGAMVCFPDGREAIRRVAGALRRAYDRAKERRVNRSARPQLAPTGAEPDTIPVEVPSDVPWQTYAQHTKELGVPALPVKKLPSKGELVQLKGLAIAEFDRVYADGTAFTDADVALLGNLTAHIEALEKAIRVSEGLPPDRSWLTMEDIGRVSKKAQVRRRCPLCGAEIGPWMGPGGKPDWRIAGYCSTTCRDAMLKSESVVRQLDAIDRRIAETTRKVADYSKRLDTTQHRVPVWLEAGETIRPYRPPWLKPNEEAARLHKATKQVCSYCNRYAVGDVCPTCLKAEAEHDRYLKGKKHHGPM